MTNKTENRLFAPLAVGFLLGAITVGTAVLLFNHSREPHAYPVYGTSANVSAPAPQPAHASMALSGHSSAASPVLEPAVARIASGFDCSCGSCSDKLDVCKCETAQHERAFIQEQLRSGHSETETAQALKAKFSGSKS